MNTWMLKIILFIAVLSLNARAQNSIRGDFPLLKGQKVQLIGFRDLGIYTIDSTTVSNQGSFTLAYTDQDLGMGYISGPDNKSYLVVLAQEQLHIKGELLSAPEGIRTITGAENKAFVNYATAHGKREQALSAWVYLQKIYQADSLFSNQKAVQQAIASETSRINNEDGDFLNQLAPQSYMKWYLPLRKLISAVGTVAQYKIEEIPNTIAAFRQLDYADPRWYHSGLLKDAIESQYWLLENRGLPLDAMYVEMNRSTDSLLQSLSQNETAFNLVTKYLFDYFEKHSLFAASEYLANQALSQNNCRIEFNLGQQLESYRAMKKGNNAQDIVFEGDVFQNGKAITTPARLSEVKAKYKLVIFGANWCPNCVAELKQLIPLYEKWKSQGVEVVFISLDTDQKAFRDFAIQMPFISSCDYKKWDTPAAKAYFVSSSPTMYLVDQNQKIVLRPISIQQLDAYLQNLK